MEKKPQRRRIAFRFPAPNEEEGSAYEAQPEHATLRLPGTDEGPSPDAPHPLRPPYRARTEGPPPGPQLARLARRLSPITIVRKFGYPGYLVSRAHTESSGKLFTWE